jgi:hypothetical protein
MKKIENKNIYLILSFIIFVASLSISYYIGYYSINSIKDEIKKIKVELNESKIQTELKLTNLSQNDTNYNFKIEQINAQISHLEKNLQSNNEIFNQLQKDGKVNNILIILLANYERIKIKMNNNLQISEELKTIKAILPENQEITEIVEKITKIQNLTKNELITSLANFNNEILYKNCKNKWQKLIKSGQFNFFKSFQIKISNKIRYNKFDKMIIINEIIEILNDNHTNYHQVSEKINELKEKNVDNKIISQLELFVEKEFLLNKLINEIEIIIYE